MVTERTLLISDVDNTLLGDNLELARFRRWYEGQRSGVRLIYSSGRFYESIVESVRTYSMPKPYAIIGGVGTDMRFFPSGRTIFAEERLNKRWDPECVRDTLAKFNRVRPQPDEFQSEFKVSFYLFHATPQDLKAIRAALIDASIGADLVYSSERDLDVVPAGFNKGSAANFAAEYLGYRRDEVIVSGDSANDLAMFEFGFRGVVVRNAHAELMALDSPLVYQSPYSFAAGVLDGIQYWLQQGFPRKNASTHPSKLQIVR